MHMISHRGAGTSHGPNTTQNIKAIPPKSFPEAHWIYPAPVYTNASGAVQNELNKDGAEGFAAKHLGSYPDFAAY